MRFACSVAAFAAVFALSTGASFAASAVQKECAAKYQAAKAANTLNGLSYNQYYKQCAAEARAGGVAATPAAAPATPAAPAPALVAPAPAAPAPTTTARAPMAPTAPAAAGAAVFPTAVSAQYQSLPAGAARRKTCDDQFKINKVNNGNGGLKWTQKGGGYYSECNKRLKG